ncbi:MAG TPA: DUF2127 domain-containing protein [Candidatus Nanoarchaeia archaeon]|nr:DUF2127 domain-containing protein [Candidatus Nanoarchaeia archaeon]
MAKNIPLGVKIISVIYWISAGLLALLGLLMMLFSSSINEVLSLMLIGLPSWAFIVLGLFLVGLGILSFFIARGLWKGRQWAFTLAILFAVLGIINDIVNLILGKINWQLIIGLVFNVIVFSYLAFNKDVRKAFPRK